MTTQDITNYYVNLLIMQYAGLPNAAATVAAFVQELISNQIYTQVQNAFNFSVSPIGLQPTSAQGIQLETVAAYTGAQRIYFGFAPNRPYFQMPDAADTTANQALGFMDAPNPSATTWRFLTAEGTQEPVYTLSDDELYRLTQLRSAAHAMPLTIQNIDNLLHTFFGNNVALFDNGNMTLYYVDLNSDTDTLFSVAAISKSLPRPAGVNLQTFRADALSHFFGLQDAATPFDSSFAGFSDGSTAQTGTFISAP